jgi:hypothetical protein
MQLGEIVQTDELTSVPGYKFVGVFLRPEPLDRRDDVVSGFSPAEGLRGGVVLLEEGHDVGAQGSDAAIDAAPDLALGDERKEALDLVEPGGTGRDQMDMPARSLDEPVADQRSLVNGQDRTGEVEGDTLITKSLHFTDKIDDLKCRLPHRYRAYTDRRQ